MTMQERWATEPRNRAFKIETTDSARCYATSALIQDDMISFNDVLKIVAVMNVQYGVKRPTVVSAFGPRDSRGRRTRYRWAWERVTTWGRVTDVLMVHVTGWDGPGDLDL
jgi:hypothetical protein